MPAYLRKIDQEHLIAIYRYGLRKIGVSVEESSEVPDWLKGRKVRSIPLSASPVGLIYPVRRFRQDANDPKVSSLLRRAGVGELSDQARYVIYSLLQELPHDPDLLDVGREQLRCIRNAACDMQRRRPLTQEEIERIFSTLLV
jgi:hypothetical protein